jgi:hypothetical protein
MYFSIIILGYLDINVFRWFPNSGKIQHITYFSMMILGSLDITVLMSTDSIPVSVSRETKVSVFAESQRVSPTTGVSRIHGVSVGGLGKKKISKLL